MTKERATYLCTNSWTVDSHCAVRPFQGMPPLVSSTGHTASRSCIQWTSTHLHRCMENAGCSSRRFVPFLTTAVFVCDMQVPEDQPVNQLKSSLPHHWAVADDLSKTAEEYNIRVPQPVTKVYTKLTLYILYMFCMHDYVNIVMFCLYPLVAVWAWSISEASHYSHWVTRECVCGCTHISWEDSSCRVCHSTVCKAPHQVRYVQQWTSPKWTWVFCTDIV